MHKDPAPDPLELVVAGPTAATADSTLAAAYALNSIPALNSLPGARVSLYLDFDGDYQAQWGGYSNITTPAYTQDTDPTTFTDAELANIQQIWRYVAEDYAPFNINVTTVQPASMANGTTQHVVIGGNGSWSGGTYGGISYVGSFISGPNTSFVFSANLGSGNAKYTGDASSHEAGHGFGLYHQRKFDASGNLVQEYSTGPGDGRAPLMGNSYSATRSLWWYGTSTSATTYQDDMAIIAGTRNAFGYRPDDVGNDAAHASPLSIAGNLVSASGIVTTTADKDYFSFRTDAGTVTLSVNVPASVNNLDARLELRDAAGNLVASSDPSTSFGATITATVAGGTYDLVVASHGSYGDVGQYTVSGTIIPPAGLISTPTGLSATAGTSGQVNLHWTDNATNETGYAVYRSTDGVNWTALAANLPASSTAYTDAAAAKGATYYYEVRAFSATTTSDFSNQAVVTLAPAAPATLAAAVVSSSRIDLSWSDVAGETGYLIERSGDQVNWAQIASTGANVTSYQNTGLVAITTYYYRVRASNAGGMSGYTSLAVATTLAAPVLPAAPSGLTARAVSANRIDLAWTDNSSNETGFIIERSSNGGKSWSAIAQTAAGVTTFSDTAINSRKTYWYRVRAVNAAGSSGYSNTAAVAAPAPSRSGLPQRSALADANVATTSESTPTRRRAVYEAVLADHGWIEDLRHPT